MDGPVDPALPERYAFGKERDRLDQAHGLLKFERTKEIVLRQLPAPPSVVADIGGGPGRYALWLAGRGHRVEHRDGAGFMLHDLDQRLANPLDRTVALEAAWATERVPELLGIGPHLPATAVRPEHRPA